MSQKKANTIFEPEMPIVPDDWEVLPFMKAAKIISDQGKRLKQRDYMIDGKIPVIDQGQDFIGGYTDNEDMMFDGELPVILFGDHTRSIKFMDKPFVVGAEGIKILNPEPSYEPKFFYYLLKSLQIPSRGYSRHFQFLKKYHLPIAPEKQQKRIVAEIEKQFSRLDEAVDNLKRIKSNLKRYKASVLKAAVEGKLTEEWRKKNLPAPSSKPGKFYTYAILCDNDSIYIGHTDDIERRWKQHLEGKGSEWTAKHKPVKIVHWEESDTRKEAADREKWLKTGYGRKWLKREYAAGRTRQAGPVEPADKLLQRIYAERRKKWEETELARLRERSARRQAKMEAKGNMPKDDKWKNRYKEAELPKEEYTFKIPYVWVWSNLGQLAWSVKDGPHYSPKYSKSGIPFISGGNIRPEGIDFSSTKYISKELHAELSKRCYPEIGDLLYTKGGTTGIARINTETKEFNVWVHVAVLKLVDSIDRFYLQHVLNSPHCYRQSQIYTHGVGNQDLGLTRMIWITIPLPPLDEQKIIVRMIVEKLAIVSEIEKKIDSNLKRTERLRQSILKEAFSGKLGSENKSQDN